jgi:very-short-patch-repair endonuclease
MKRASIPLSELKKTACANLNKQLFREEVKPKKESKYKQLPGQMCQQAQWMWGQLAAWVLVTGIPVEKEYRFHPIRKWRFDFAIPSKMIAIEYEGLNSLKSGHTTLSGYTKDTEKYNEAQALGWKVIRFTVKNYKGVLKQLEKQIKQQ